MQPGVESLNAAAATAIALYVWSSRTPVQEADGPAAPPFIP